MRALKTIAWIVCGTLAAGTPALLWGQGMFMNPLEERAMGVQFHPKVLEEKRGLYPDARFNNYVVGIAKRIAEGSAKHPDQFVFSVVNDTSFNAVTMPGGFVYLHAEILSWINDEAELTALIGHEVGHAINRHAAKAMARENVSKVAYKLGMLSPRMRARAAEIKEGLMLKNIAYGQDQEYEADGVGFVSDSKLGLDSMGAARMLYQLQRHDDWHVALFGPPKNAEPAYLQSHPQSMERVQRAIKLAEDQGGTSAPKGRDQYLSMLNGMKLVYVSKKGEKTVRYVRVVTVKPSDTLTSLAKRDAVGAPLVHLLAFNGLDRADQIKPGMKIKILSAT